MGQVLTMPGNVERSWRAIRPGFVDMLRAQGVAERHHGPILEELGAYYLGIDQQVLSSFQLPEGLLDDHQLQMVRDEYLKHLFDVRGQLYTPLMKSFAVILGLLVEKHRGQFKPVA